MVKQGQPVFATETFFHHQSISLGAPGQWPALTRRLFAALDRANRRSIASPKSAQLLLTAHSNRSARCDPRE
jgi:hypothetical protein